jgi:prepilin-type N-terminal cleavage/methylation domain-containing protein
MKPVLSPHGYCFALSRHGPAPGPLHPKGKGAFTLVELIAVIAIMAILSATVIGGVLYAGRKAAITATQGLFERLSVAINMYNGDWGAYPPDRNPSWPNPGGWGSWSMRDRTDIGNLNHPGETLWYFLAGIYQEPRGSGANDVIDDDEFQALVRKTTYMDFRENELRRVGVAFWMTNQLKDEDDQYSSSDEFPEIIDAWGSPINYVALDTINTANPRANKESFDLVSRGPDRFTGAPYDERNVKVKGIYTNRDNIANFPLKD